MEFEPTSTVPLKVKSAFSEGTLSRVRRISVLHPYCDTIVGKLKLPDWFLKLFASVRVVTYVGHVGSHLPL